MVKEKIPLKTQETEIGKFKTKHSVFSKQQSKGKDVEDALDDKYCCWPGAKIILGMCNYLFVSTKELIMMDGW